MILLVEDNSMFRKMLKRILKITNLEIIEAENGEEGFIKFLENISTVKAVISDVMMPQMDGLTMAKEIREFSNTPIIFLTAWSDNDTISSSKKIENSIYLQKPLDEKELISHLESL